MVRAIHSSGRTPACASRRPAPAVLDGSLTMGMRAGTRLQMIAGADIAAFAVRAFEDPQLSGLDTIHTFRVTIP
jgi:hypothetical protein